jgi:hypothetical protein
MNIEVGKIYECFGTFVLCTGTKQIISMAGETFQGVVVETNENEGTFFAKYSDTWSSEQFKGTNKKIKLENNDKKISPF